MQKQWVTMKVAALRSGLSAMKISRWANKGYLEVKTYPLDRRVRLINFAELETRIADLDSTCLKEQESLELKSKVNSTSRNKNEHWVTMSAAARKLGITINRISRWAAKGQLEVQTLPVHKKYRLVNFIEVQARVKEMNDTMIGDNKNKDNGKADP